MKAIITFFLLFVSVLSYGQSEKYFDYRISKSSRSQVDSNYLVTPKFEVNPYKKGIWVCIIRNIRRQNMYEDL